MPLNLKYIDINVTPFIVQCCFGRGGSFAVFCLPLLLLGCNVLTYLSFRTAIVRSGCISESERHLLVEIAFLDALGEVASP